MDRRKLQSKSGLHKRLHSASQLVAKTVSDSVKNNIVRSVSTDEHQRFSRKRKNSEDEEKNLSQVSSKKTINSFKKKRNLIHDSDNEEETEEETLPMLPDKIEKLDRFSKLNESQESNSIRNLSDSSDKDEEHEQNKSTAGSYIKGVLEALDKSPSKLSQISNSSVDKYRKINIRVPTRSKFQVSSSKTIAERFKEKINKPQKSEKSLNNLQIEKSDLENTSIQSTSIKRNDLYEYRSPSNSIILNHEDSSSDIDDFPIKKVAKESKDKSFHELLNTTTKNKIDNNSSNDEMRISPSKNYGDRTKKSSVISPFKNDVNIENNNMDNINFRRKKTYIETDDKLTKFFNEAGITLYGGENLHIASDDPRVVIQKMKKIITLNSFKVDEIIESWNNYIDDEENLKKSLLEIKIETDDGIGISSKAVSLSRILLQTSELQVQIFESLFKKLIDAVITSESSDDAPWAIQMIQQFRFLEIIVDSDFLILQIEGLLSSSPEWFQREVIVFIPDIITDTHHHETAEMLIKIMKNNQDLTNIILDCIQNLILSGNYKEELREKVLNLLNNDISKSSLPSITRFILDACATEEIALKSLKALRLVDMTSNKKEIDECYTNQMFITNAIKMNIQLFKEVTQAALTIIKTCYSEPVPLDIIMTILLYETLTVKKKIIETTLFHHIKNGYYKTSLLNVLYTEYKEVAKSFQSTALNLSISLLKANSSVHIEFGIEWLRNIFISQSETTYKQREILERLLNLMGNKDKTVKNALEVLCRMANDDVESQYFKQHAAFLRCFVDKIDHLQFDEVAILYHLLHGLCTQSELISNLLSDDLSIIMQKHLHSSRVLTKCKGVIGAVMAIKHLSGNIETSNHAFELLKNTLNNLRNCVKSQILFFDQLGQIIISINTIDDQLLSDITNFFEDNFVSSCLVESSPSDNLVPKFGLNDPTMAESYYVNFGNGNTGAFASAFFKLLRICNLRQNGSLESINAVLGCSLLMPEDLDIPEPLTAVYMINCINWFREIIGGFVTQTETLLREQVLRRLQSLMTLQGEFVTMLSMCGNLYQPPPCYFHYFPIPQFNRIDTKFGKKKNKKGKTKSKIKSKEGDKEEDEEDKEEDKEKDKIDSILNKSLLLPEWHNWVQGSELTIRNPAFFRQMDTKIINLFDMDVESCQTPCEKITIAQVCFIVKEILGMFKNETSEDLVRDLIKLLPKICNKFKNIISDLRECESEHEKEAVRLILCLLTTIFSWKEFENAKYNILLRDGLRTLAGMMNKSNALLRTCKDLVAEACKYFESLADIATQISIAVALVNICNCLMKHSTSFMEQSKGKQAKMAFGFLCLEWSNEIHGPQYKVAIKVLLKMWLDNEPDPLESVSSILLTLPEEVKSFHSPQSRLSTLASINKMNFHLLVKELFVGLTKGIDVSLNLVETDPERIKIWMEVALCLEKLANICKIIKNNVYLVLFVRYTTILYQILLTSGMKLLEMNCKYQTEEVLGVIRLFQRSGRFLRDIFCTARKDKNVSLLKLIPIAKSRRERFIYRVKGMLTANNSTEAFWMGNLLNKDLDGEEIDTESSEDVTMASELTAENITHDTESEIFNSDSDSEEDTDDDA